MLGAIKTVISLGSAGSAGSELPRSVVPQISATLSCKQVQLEEDIMIFR